jgi:hypothetical protein
MRQKMLFLRSFYAKSKKKSLLRTQSEDMRHINILLSHRFKKKSNDEYGKLALASI